MSDNPKKLGRRDFLKVVGGTGLLAGLGPRLSLAGRNKALTKVIPKSKEPIPVIGMGTSRTFDVGSDTESLNRLAQVTQAFFDAGGTMIDSSPMYGSSEEAIGKVLKQTKGASKLFAATKVWTYGEDSGIRQMEQSREYWGVKRFDLMQIHNLRDWQIHLDTLKEWKAQGKIRYIGITTSHGRFHEDLAIILKEHDFDFVQFSYNIQNREVESRLLPIAVDRGIAVIVNRPFQKGALFRKVRGKSLPDWVSEFDCQSWGQFFLKFVVSHSAVTCAIPATSKPHHMIDNMGANSGRLPGTKMRRRMIRFIEKV